MKKKKDKKQCIAENGPEAVIPLRPFQQKRDRGATPQEIVAGLMKDIDQIEEIVIITNDENGVVRTAYSMETALNGLGMLDIGREDIMDALRGWV